MDVDPLASMRCWPIELEVGGRTFDIPALPAADWWPVLASGDLSGILDMVVSTPGDPSNIDDLLLEGAFSPTDLGEALTDVIEVATGRSYHAALVLAVVTSKQWASINGALALRGFRWDVQPIGAALDAIYAEVTSRLDSDGLSKFTALLENEGLTSGKKSRPRARERIVGEFESMAGPRPTSGVKATGAPSDNARPRTRTQPRPRRPVAPSTGPRKQP